MPHESTAPKTKMIHTMERFPSFLLFATAPCSIRLKSPTQASCPDNFSDSSSSQAFRLVESVTRPVWQAHVLEPTRDVEKLGEELLGKDVVEHLHGGSFYADETSHFIPLSDMPADAIRFPIMPYCSTSRSAPDTRLRHSPLPHRTALPEFNG